MDLYDMMTEEDMPNEDMRFIYANLGREVAIQIMQLFPGTTIQVPSNCFRFLQQRLVSEHKGKMSVKDMALQFRMNQKTVYHYLQKERDEKRQRTLFEEPDDGDTDRSV